MTLSVEKRSPTFARFIYLFLVALAYWKCLLTYFGHLVYSVFKGFELNELFQLSKGSAQITHVSHASADSCQLENGVLTANRCTVRNISPLSGHEQSLSIQSDTSVNVWRNAVPYQGKT